MKILIRLIKLRRKRKKRPRSLSRLKDKCSRDKHPNKLDLVMMVWIHMTT